MWLCFFLRFNSLGVMGIPKNLFYYVVLPRTRQFSMLGGSSRNRNVVLFIYQIHCTWHVKRKPHMFSQRICVLYFVCCMTVPVPERTQQVIIIHLFFCFSVIFVLFVITWNLCTICISMFCRHFSLTSKIMFLLLFSIRLFFFCLIQSTQNCTVWVMFVCAMCVRVQCANGICVVCRVRHRGHAVDIWYCWNV